MNIAIAMGIPFANVKNRLLAFDTFNRANNTSSLGNADSGQTWQALVGTWGINNNLAYVSATSADSFAVIDTGKPDVEINAVFSIMRDYQRIVFRYKDTSNFLMVQNVAGVYYVYKMVAGSFTSLGSYTLAQQNGAKIAVIAKGSSIKLVVNDVVILSVTETFNQTITKHGIGCAPTTASMESRWDNFKVEDI